MSAQSSLVTCTASAQQQEPPPPKPKDDGPGLEVTMKFIQDKLSDRAKTNFAELLRGNHVKPVYHGESGVRTLRGLARSYLTTVEDLTRVMSRLKALYRSRAVRVVPSGWDLAEELEIRGKIKRL